MNIRDFPDALLQDARIEAAKCKTTLREFVIAAVEKSVDDMQLAVPSEPQTDTTERGSESEKPPLRGEASPQTEPAAVTVASDPRVSPASEPESEESAKPPVCSCVVVC